MLLNMAFYAQIAFILINLGNKKYNTMQYIDINELHEWDLNPRYVKKEDFEALKKDLKSPIAKQFFEARPIIVSSRTGKYIIIAGNTRYKASKELGFKSVPVVILHGLTEEQEQEINIKDNVHRGKFDFDMIANNFDAVKFEEWGGNISGFDSNFELFELEETEDPEERPQKEKKEKESIQLDSNFSTQINSVNNIIDLAPRSEYLQSLGVFGSSESITENPAIVELIFRLFSPDNCKALEIEPANSIASEISKILGIEHHANQCHPLDIEKEYSDIDFIYIEYKHISENYNTELGYLHKLIRKINITLTKNRFFVIMLSERSDKSGAILPVIAEIMKYCENDEAVLYNHLIFYSDGHTKLKDLDNKRKLRGEKTHALCFYKGATAKIKEFFPKIS